MEERIEEEKRAAAEETERRNAEEAERKARGNGNVKLIYERYDEEFPIVDGSCTAADIDDVYCLSFVMPGCLIHLSSLSPQDKRVKEAEIDEKRELINTLQTELISEDTTEERKLEVESELEAARRIASMDVFIKEEPKGTFQGLEKDITYYVYVEQEAEKLKRDQERMAYIASQIEGAGESSNRNEKDNVGTESCSCIFGNPCVDPVTSCLFFSFDWNIF